MALLADKQEFGQRIAGTDARELQRIPKMAAKIALDGDDAVVRILFLSGDLLGELWDSRIEGRRLFVIRNYFVRI